MQHVNRPFAANFLAISAILFATCFLCASSHGQDSEQQTVTHRKIARYEDSAPDFLQALNRAATQLDVPLGVELEGAPPSPRPTSVQVINGTVGDVFSALVKQTPGYEWVAQNGVIDVMPTGRANSILDIRVSVFQIHNVTPGGVVDAIRSLPEVKAWLAENDVTERSWLPPSILAGTDTDRGSLSLELHNVTLREIMNSVLEKGKLHGWTVARYGTANQYVNIQIG